MSCLPFPTRCTTKTVFSRSVPAAAFGLLARNSLIQGCNLSLAVPCHSPVPVGSPESKGNRPLWWSTEEYRKRSLWLFSADKNREVPSPASKDLTNNFCLWVLNPGFWCCSSWCQSLYLSTFSSTNTCCYLKCSVEKGQLWAAILKV